jgi:iron complex outermembrane recepter protein
MEGKADINKNSDYDDAEDVYLTGRRITPLKLVSHIKYSPNSRMFTNLEWIYSGERKRFAPLANGTYRFGEGPVDAYGIINLTAGYKMTNGLNFFAGVENLLNKNYYPTTSQWYALHGNYVKANGIRYQVGIGYKW